MPEVKVPEIKQADVKVPEVKVPKLPEVKVPDVKIPKQPEAKVSEVNTVPKAVEVINWPKDITNKETTAEVKPVPKAVDAKPAEVKPVPKAVDAKPAEIKPTEVKPAEVKPVPKAVDAKPAEVKPAEVKPVPKAVDAKPAEIKPAEVKPVPKAVDAKPAEIKPVEPKTSKSESYKINGKEVEKEKFDDHMKANLELAKLMEGIKPKAGGDMASSSGGKDPAADAMERMKAIQAQVGKVNEETAQKDLANKQTNLEKTQGFAEQQIKIHGKAEQEKANVTQSITLNTLGLNSRQKEMHGELAKLTLDESKAKLESNKKQQEVTLAEMRALDAKANAIEETAKKEGRALTESEQAQVDAIDKENQEKLKASSKANTTMADENKVLEKLIKQKTFAEKEGLEVYIKKDGERVKLVEENSAKIALDMKEALPVKEIAEKKTEFSGQLAEAGKNLDEHGKTTLKYAMTYSSESNAAYKASAEQSIENTKNQIEEKNKLVAELEEKGKTQELSTREKKRLEITKSEIQELEEKKKFREQEVEAYTIAEKQKKGIIDKSTTEIADAIKESLPVKDIEKGKDLLAERIELQNKAEEDAIAADEEEIARIEVAAQAKFAAAEEEAIAREEIAALLPKSIDLEKQRIELQNKAEQDAMLADEEEIARIDTESLAKIAAAREEEMAREEVAALLPKSIDLEKQRIELQNKAEQDAMLAEEEEIARADAAALTAKDALYGIMENVGDNFNDVMSNNMDEFGSNFDEVIGGQILENMNFKPTEIDQSYLPTAKDKNDEAYLKTSKAANNDEAYLKTASPNKIDKEALKASMPKYSDISLDASGMPVVKSKAKELTKKEEPPKQDTSVETAEAAKFKRQSEAAKKTDDDKKKSDGGKEQHSNLDDVVKKLDMLNNTMNSLIRKTDEVSANQIKATKGIASGNLFGAY